MLVTRKHLSRRTLLRGLGTAVALPFLDSMVPAFAGTAAVTFPNRLFFTYIPIGAIMDEWYPTGGQTGFEFKRILAPVQAFRDDITVVGGLDHHTGYALGDGGGDHARAGACYLTGVHPKKTSGADIHAGVSVDQIIAAHQALSASPTKFASIELGCEDSRTIGACDSGYSCAYQNSVSWRTPTSPMPPETNPRVVFERMFGSEDLSIPADVRARRTAARKSILDFVTDDTKRLEGGLGSEDRHKIDEYLFAVREIEKRIENAEKDNAARPFTPSLNKPAGVPVLFADYLKLMFDIQFLAMQADLTRTATFMIGREGSQRTYDEIGIPEPHHPLTHHRGNKESIEKVTQINTFHAQQLAYFLGKMKATKEGDGTLLDHSMMVYGSGIADGSEHSHINLPIIIAGHGNGALKGGQFVKYAAGTPTTNLWLTLLDRMGVHEDSVGDSTGRLEHLTDL